jgi:RNA polymerase sigma-70 factor, ECF subfamily
MTVLEFDNSFNKMATLLQSFAYNLTKNMDDAKDLFQETSYRAITNRDKFREGTNLKAWLFTIMKNIFINNYRKKVKSNTIIDGTDNQFYINSMSISNPNRAESDIMMQELNQMVAELDDNIQVPFVMHYQGFKYQEIADDLQLPLGTVKSRIFFARKELKDKINARYDNLGRIYERGLGTVNFEEN